MRSSETKISHPLARRGRVNCGKLCCDGPSGFSFEASLMIVTLNYHLSTLDF